MRKLFFLLLLVTVSNGLLFAQSAEEEIKGLVRKAYQDLSNLKTASQTKQFAETYLTKDFTVHTRMFYDGKKVRDETWSMESFIRDLSKTGDLGRLTRERVELEEIEFVKTTGDIAVVSYSAKIFLEEKGKVISEGNEVRIDRLRKMADGWKTFSSNSDIVINTVNRAACLYRYFSNNSPFVLIKVDYPAGRRYRTDILELTYKDLGDKAFEISTSGNDTFLWRNDKLQWMEDKQVSFPAKNRTEVAEELIKYYWSSQCPEVKSAP